MATDPEKIREINYELVDVNNELKSLNQTLQGILGPYAPVIAKQATLDKELADLEQELDEAIRKNKNSNTVKSLTRKKLFLQQLKYRGYDLTAKNKVIKSQERLSSEQREKLYWLDKQLDKENALAKALDKPVESFRGISTSVNSLEGIFNLWQKNLIEASGKNVGKAVVFQSLFTISNSLFKSFDSMTEALYRGERGASVASKGYKELFEGVSTLAVGIGTAMTILPFGKFKILAKAFGAGLAIFGIALKKSINIVELTGKANDSLYKSYNEISQVGAATAEGMTGLQHTLHDIGGSVGQIEQFNKLIVENAKSMSIFGGSVTKGVEFYRKVAASITNIDSPITKEFMLLGITADNQREAIAKYMAEETRLGLLKDKNENYAQRGAVEYIEKLQRITMLTGATRKEQEEARNAIMAEQELRAAMYEAEKDKTPEGIKKLQKLKRAFEAAAVLRLKGDVRGATGVSQYAAAGGMTNAESAAAYQTFGGRGGLLEYIEKGGTEIDMAKSIAKGYKRQLEKIGPTVAIAGFEAGAGFMTAPIYVAVDFSNSVTAFMESAEKAGRQPETFLQYLQRVAKETPDEKTQLNVEAQIIQQKTAQNLDKAAAKFGMGTLALKGASEVMEKAVKLFREATKTTKKKGEPLDPYDEGYQGNVAKEWEKFGKEAESFIRKGVSTTEETLKNYRSRAGTRAATPPPVPVPTPPTTGAPPVPAEPAKPSVPPKSIKIDDVLSFSGNTGSKANFEALDNNFKDRVIAAAQEFNAQTGNKLIINSAYRSSEEQRRLYEETKRARRPGVGPTGMPVAPPGRSKHEHGLAIDIQNYRDKAAVAALTKQGLKQVVGEHKDPVHFELKAQTGGLFEGPREGYFVQLHGKEMIGNQKHLEQIKKLISVAEQNNILSTKAPIDEDTSVDDITSELLISFSEMLETKVDELTEKIRSGNSTDEDLLNYSRA